MVLPIIEPEASRPETRHIQITVQPAEASLYLDNRVAGGNLIKLDVQRSQSSHVVQAKAPGHVPFKKTINFANDVYLDIKLEKVEPPASVRVKSHSLQVAAQPPKVDTDPRDEPKLDQKVDPKIDGKMAPAVAPVEDFGMTLQRPNTRRPTKKIDETDPYAP